MEWLIENWILIMLGLTFIPMSFFAHGYHGRLKKQPISKDRSDHRY